MAEEYTPLDLQISDAELELFPPVALRLIIRKLLEHIAHQDLWIKELETEVSQLKARLDQNSSNSNKPPSTDSPYKENAPKTNKAKSGGRKGHKGHRQQLIPTTTTEIVHPGPCTCGCRRFAALRPYHTYQHIELPEIAMTVIHFILYRGKCSKCGKTGKGHTPQRFQTGFGPRLCALVAEIGSIEGNSRQAILSFCSSVLGISISLGAIQNIIDRASNAIGPHYEAIGEKAHAARVNHVDETPWNNNGKPNWLWIMASSVVAYYMVHTHRSKGAFESLVGGWEGILVCDGHRLYQNWVHAHQTCLAHLIRRAKGLVVRKDPELVRCGAWARDELRRFYRMVNDPPTKAEWHAFYARLNRLIALYIDSDSEAGKLVRHIDTEMGSLFTFLLEEGVDPTNNFGERMLRYAVLW